jgi:hypothetical protein
MKKWNKQATRTKRVSHRQITHLSLTPCCPPRVLFVACLLGLGLGCVCVCVFFVVLLVGSVVVPTHPNNLNLDSTHCNPSRNKVCLIKLYRRNSAHLCSCLCSSFCLVFLPPSKRFCSDLLLIRRMQSKQ